MINPPKTLIEAKKVRYGISNSPYKEGKCVYQVWDNFYSYQCSRRNGHGPDRLYCKQHAKKVEA